jgi:hypothetical protein
VFDNSSFHEYLAWTFKGMINKEDIPWPSSRVFKGYLIVVL